MNIAFTIVDDSGLMDSSPLIRSTIKIGNFKASDQITGSRFPPGEIDSPKWQAKFVRPAVNTVRGQCSAIYVEADPIPIAPLGLSCTGSGPADDLSPIQCDYVLTISYDGSSARSCVEAIGGIDLDNLTLVVSTQAVSQGGIPGDVSETLYDLRPAIKGDDGPT